MEAAQKALILRLRGFFATVFTPQSLILENPQEFAAL
jgi:hypothetical protein